MFKHALTLIWNRRRANRLVVIEIAAAFVILFVLAAVSIDLWTNYRRPLGYQHQDIWRVQGINPGGSGVFGSGNDSPAGRELDDIMRALRTLPRTEALGIIQMTPYDGGSGIGGYYDENGNEIESRENRASAEALQAIGVELVDGRWFGTEDEGQDYEPVLVNRAFVELAFPGSGQALNNPICCPDPGEDAAEAGGRENRVVGVIAEFRQDGEFSEPEPYVMRMSGPSTVSGQYFTLLLRVAPGTEASFEEQIVETVESVAPGWVVSVTPWEQLRETRNARILLPLKAGATIASFFIVLVVMGLIGALWQDVIRRTQEIGLRRALGAPSGRVRAQIQIEMLVVGGFGVVVGAVIAAQFPLLALVGPIDWQSAVPALLLSAASMLALVLLGALYPSWLASRREPADALRYE